MEQVILSTSIGFILAAIGFILALWRNRLEIKWQFKAKIYQEILDCLADIKSQLISDMDNIWEQKDISDQENEIIFKSFIGSKQKLTRISTSSSFVLSNESIKILENFILELNKDFLMEDHGGRVGELGYLNSLVSETISNLQKAAKKDLSKWL